MDGIDERTFRALLDKRGLLRPGALASPARSGAFTVFAQKTSARLDLAAIRVQAERFFDARIGLTVDKRYGPEEPETDAARVVVATAEPGASGTRLCFGRRADAGDHAAAEAAEQAQQTTGMSLLAHRCRTVWLVATEGPEDAVALTIAAILASVLLGPILPPSGLELFGVRTARSKLELSARRGTPP
jgi:hypothetical protein